MSYQRLVGTESQVVESYCPRKNQNHPRCLIWYMRSQGGYTLDNVSEIL